jgi:DNA-binding NarL/FixJ family response regulator
MFELTRIGSSAQQARTRIVLIEEHAIVREGLKALIETEPEFEVVGDFGFGEQCLEGLRRLQPSLILTDLTLPGRTGFDFIADIGTCCPAARKLVLTEHGSEECIRAAFSAGADGYILKDANRAELLSAIRTVAAGQQFLCKAIASMVLSRCFSDSEPRMRGVELQSITGREREVLTRIALGESNKVIARALDLSVKTVEKHRSNLMRKLRLHNTAAITLYAVRHGLAGGARVAG